VRGLSTLSKPPLQNGLNFREWRLGRYWFRFQAAHDPPWRRQRLSAFRAPGEKDDVHRDEPLPCEERFGRGFREVWLNRDTFLGGVPGFVEFHLLKGPEGEDHTLYASHTVWQNKSAFEAWTRSDAFRAAHARAGNETTGPLYLEHPKFEGFEVRQTLTRGAAVA
jgi:heme-degrading monooxygenase HmoA